EKLLHLGVRQRLAELRRYLLEPREDRARLGHALLDVATHVLRGIELRLLRQVADAQAVGGKRLPEEILVDAGHDAEQRRLAGAGQAAGLGHQARAWQERKAGPGQRLRRAVWRMPSWNQTTEGFHGNRTISAA